MTNKKGDKKGERKQNGDKTDTTTNKKGNKKGDKRKQQGGHSFKALRTPNSIRCGEKVKKSPSRQKNRNAAPVETSGRQQCRHRTWETKVNKSHK